MRPRAWSTDDGFSLIEATMASLIVVLLFAGFGKSMSVAFSGSHDNAVAQEATALAVEQLEFVRSLEWDEVALAEDPGAAPMVDAGAGTLRGTEAGLAADELIFVDDGGLVQPLLTEIVDGTPFSIHQIVSTASDDLRRVVVLVSWEIDGVVSSYLTSTLVSEASTR